MAKYPDVKQFPKEVAEDINKGISPIVAYEAYLQKKAYEDKMEELNKMIAKEQKKEKNKAKTTGSLKDTDEGVDKDYFSEGLFG
jgi:hypothetical protein